MGTPAQSGEAENHHFLPRFYLKGFMGQGKLWVYEHGTTAPRESKPKNEGHRLNYNTVAVDGHPDNQVEEMFGKVESLLAPTAKKLANPQS
jgi:hypothetical protein